MILMKETNGASFQFRAFQDLPAVARFFENASGKVRPRTLYNGMKIVPQNDLSEENLSKWTPINSEGSIGYFEIIRAEVAEVEIPDDLKWFEGRSNAFGRGQEFIPDMTSFLNP